MLAFLAVLALLASPVTAAAARVSCGSDARMAASGMDMPAMARVAHIAGSTTKGDPCCDPSGKSHKSNGKSCMQACAATCAVAVALPAPVVTAAPAVASAARDWPVTASAHGLDPPRLERPPKSIA